MKLQDAEIQAVLKDIQSRLRLRENGQRFKMDRKHVYYSPAKILYVPVFAHDSTPGGLHRILDTFSAVEREASNRFNMDVLVLPATKNGHDSNGN